MNKPELLEDALARLAWQRRVSLLVLVLGTLAVSFGLLHFAG